MDNMLEDGMTEMMATLLAYAGTEVIYRRQSQSCTPTMHKRPQMPVMIDNGEGQLVAVMITDFLIDPANLEFGEPVLGDFIDMGGERYTVCSGASDKVFRQMAKSLMRIHTKRVR